MSLSERFTQRLSSALAELMRAALCEIWKAVEETVSESRVEITRRQRENEALRRRLQALRAARRCEWSRSSGADGPPEKRRGAGRLERSCGQGGREAGAVEASALPDSGERAPIEQQHCEQEWSSSLRQDTEPTDTEDNQGLTEQHRSRQSEEELRGLESGHMEEPQTEGSTQGHRVLGSDTAESKFKPPCVMRSDPDLDSTHSAELPRIQSVGSDYITTEDNTLESAYIIERSRPLSVSLKRVRVRWENITDSTCDLEPEPPVDRRRDSKSAALNSGVSGGSDGTLKCESLSSQRRQLRPRPPTFSSPPPQCGKLHHNRSPQCGKSYTGKGDGKKNHRNHRGERSYSCSKCGKSFAVSSQLKYHQIVHTGEKPYCCTQCGKGFCNAGYLHIHKRIHTGEKPYSCVQCGKSFISSTQLKRHQKIHTGEKPYCCTQCGKGFCNAGYLHIHKRIHTGEKPYSCVQCGKSFISSTQLKRHQKIHTGEKPYCCTQCGKGFCNAGYLHIHKLIHTGEKPYSCVQCGKSFISSTKLKRHQRIHTGEKPYCCTQCGKGFTQSTHLKCHQRIHTGEKPYCCTQCGKGFCNAGYLHIHKRIHTGEKPYSCVQCGKSFISSTKLKRHQKIHIGEKP
ncbi:zinc finger protein ZFP2-like [Amia ocellicauda]|uniref:zinc finger protein ZFP2-like n=1 Tax=Amia ocellicauda TaxID=2972642 RepID=UPI003464723A